jgi:NAD(P)-dependent dehydrogenase (short-subunit alcohol dehydrogenase family)/acyl carrier protein
VGEEEVAYRGGRRWVKCYERVKVGGREGAFTEGGVYLILGGMEGVTFAVAEFLAQGAGARLSIADEAMIPPCEEWPGWLSAHDEEDPISRKIAKARFLQKLGAEVMWCHADVSDVAGMNSALAKTYERYGVLNGVIFSPGQPAEEFFTPIEDMTFAQSERVFESSVYGLYVLEEALRSRRVDFCLLCSSLSSELGGPGYVAHTAASRFMDYFALNKRDQRRWLSINWDVWRPESRRAHTPAAGRGTNPYGITAREAVEITRRIYSHRDMGQIIVSTGDLSDRVARRVRVEGERGDSRQGAGTSSPSHPRPDLQTPYVPPDNELESTIARILERSLGIEKIGVYDNFFDLGGDSLTALQVIAELKKAFKRELSVVSLYEVLTTRALADMLADRHGNEGAAGEDVNAEGEIRQEKLKRRKQFQQKKRSGRRDAPAEET